MAKMMLVNTVEGRECRIAILEDNRLEELYTERASSASQVGNIYKGKVTNVEPSIQAAFIDFGGTKNGFLHISDVHPQFFPKSSKQTEPVGRRSPHKSRPPIQQCLKRNQEIVVQMTKEGIGTKGPTLTTYLSIPGRLVVMMPGMSQTGISRKIEDEDDRAKIRKILDQVEVPRDMGIIVRTAGVGRSKRDIQRDMSYLTRLWKSVQNRIDSSKAPAEIYQESDLVIRTLRDVFDSDIKRIICDRKSDAFKVKEFLHVAVPRAKCKIELYNGKRGLFEHFAIEEEIERIHSHRVDLRQGGSLIIEQTEALVAIDVNSGSFRQHSDAEINALKLNLIAAEEIGRQLRLRDMGGVIVMDFVDMRHEKNRRQLEKKLRDVLKIDRAKSKVLRISSFGIVEMTRQRLRPSLKQSIYTRCPHCGGTGQLMSDESVTLSLMRDLRLACAEDDVARIELLVPLSVAHHLTNTQRKAIADLERKAEKNIIIRAEPHRSGGDVEISCTNARGAQIAFDALKSKSDSASEPEIVDIRNLKKRDEKPREEPEAKKEPEPKEQQKEQPKKRRRGKRGGRKRRKQSTSGTETDAEKKDQASPGGEGKKEAPKDDNAAAEEAKPGKKKKPRRRKKKSDKSQSDEKPSGGDDESPARDDGKKTHDEPKSDADQPSKKKRRRRRKKKTDNAEGKSESSAESQSDS